MTEQEILAEQPKAKAVFALSGKVDTKVKQWSKKYKVDEGYIMSIFMGYMTKDEDERKALLSTLGDLQNESGRDAFYVYVLKDSGPVNMFELMRQKVIRYLEDPDRHDEAIENGWAWEDGTVLDYREKVFGKINEHKGEPLTGDDWQRTITAIVADNEEFDGAIKVDIKSNGDAAKDTPLIEPFTYYKAFINQSKTNKSRYTFGKTSGFKVITPVVSNAEVANKIPTVALGEELEQEYKEKYAGKKYARYITTPVRATVTFLTLDPVRGKRTVILTDEDTEEDLRCNIREDIPVKYRRADELLAFVSLFATKAGKIGAEIKAYMVI